jgi:hypothetical protein
MENTTTAYLPESSPPTTIFADRGGNIVRAAAHVAQGALLLERARRDSLSGNKSRLFSDLAERLREMGKAIERVGRSEATP